MTVDQDDPAHWSHQDADYEAGHCVNCSRQRILRYSNGRRICEKCNWDQFLGDYAPDHERVG